MRCSNASTPINGQLSAYITVTGDLARAQAKQAEQDIAAGNYRGPLHGIPFALKDIYNTAGILTSGGSKVCADNIPATNATTTQKLLDAGAILLGKLQTHEFAHGGPSFDLPWPPARNPVEPRPFHRRVVQWLRRRTGRGPDARRTRVRHRWVHPRPSRRTAVSLA